VPAELRRAVVTGSSRGIGAAIAADLRRNGMEVISASRSDGVNLTASAAREAFAAAVLAGGDLDLLVNAAGCFAGGSLRSADLAAARALFELDFWAPLELTKLLLPGLERRRGAIVNIGSLNGGQAQADTSIYCAAKAALEMATRCLARELAPIGVRVNAVAPGPVPTALLAEALGDVPLDRIAPLVPLRRLGTAADVSAAVRFLAGPDASWVTGQVLRVDGGLSS